MSTLSTLKAKQSEKAKDKRNSEEDRHKESTKEDEEPVAGPSGVNHKKAESNRKSKLLSIAPKLPFDIDLYHWEDEKLIAPTVLS